MARYKLIADTFKAATTIAMRESGVRGPLVCCADYRRSR
jgi:hypothetical protein